MKTLNASQIDCVYKQPSNGCLVPNLQIKKQDQKITSISNDFPTNHTYQDIREFHILDDVETKYTPTGICNYFSEMMRINIQGAKQEQRLNILLKKHLKTARPLKL